MAGESEVNVLQGTPGAENSLFPGAPLDSLASDVLGFPGEPRLVAGERNVYVREGSSRGLSLDRVRLLAVDHPIGSESAPVAGGGIVAGTRIGPTSVAGRSGVDLTAEASGASAQPIYADSGEVLAVALTPADSTGGVLLVESSRGNPRGGISVESATDGVRLGTIHPRVGRSTQAVRLLGRTQVRIRFTTACAVSFIGRLDSVSPAAVTSATLARASVSGMAVTDGARLLDGDEVVVPAADTLQLAFTDAEAAATGYQRNWYLALDGTPVSALTATFLAARASQEGAPPPLPTRFALHQNVPNPFRSATEFRFDLPVAADVRLEVFDALGRLVRMFRSLEPAGRHRLEWDLSDSRGRVVPAGVYTYRMRAGAFEARRKMVVLP